MFGDVSAQNYLLEKLCRCVVCGRTSQELAFALRNCGWGTVDVDHAVTIAHTLPAVSTLTQPAVAPSEALPVEPIKSIEIQNGKLRRLRWGGAANRYVTCYRNSSEMKR